MNGTLYRLSQRTARLDEAIRTELRRATPSSIRLLRLRILRLAITSRMSGTAPKLRTT